MKITSNLQGSELIISLIGRIDSICAGEAESLVLKAITDNAHESLTLDAKELEYISSAGLRIVLKVRKLEKNIKIVDVSTDVYEVFQMTGFTEMMNIQKAYRKLSVEGCELIGTGANGKVYRHDPEIVIKVYNSPDCLPEIVNERELARKAFILGVPTAIPFDVVQVGNTYGSVFELLNSKSFSKLIATEPNNKDKYIDMSVELLKKINSTDVSTVKLPSIKEKFISRVSKLKDYLPESCYEKLYRLFSDVPEDQRMIHGDFHMKNIMLQNGEAILIDMDTLCHGNPVFELGAIYLAYKAFTEIDHEEALEFLGFDYDTACYIWNRTITSYFDTSDEAIIRKYEQKAMLVANVRKMERSIRHNGFDTPEGTAEIELSKKHIVEIVECLDSLAI